MQNELICTYKVHTYRHTYMPMPCVLTYIMLDDLNITCSGSHNNNPLKGQYFMQSSYVIFSLFGQDCFYSHKNFMRPELQPDTHRSFDDEVRTDSFSESLLKGYISAHDQIYLAAYTCLMLHQLNSCCSKHKVSVLADWFNAEIIGVFQDTYCARTLSCKFSMYIC